MNDVRALFTRRWIGYLVLVVVFAVACCFLGTWQFARRAEALAEIARIDANYDHAPVPLAEALPDPESFDVAVKWLPVELTGSYLPAGELAVRNRPYEGNVGYEVLTPFRLDDGSVFFVNRGWIPRDESGGLGAVPPPPAGEVTIAARLKADEGAIAGRSGTDRTLASIDLTAAAERIGEPAFTGAYGLLVQEPGDAATPPLPAPRPERDEGPHLSYALQWFVFAIMAFVALWWFARQERRNAEESAELATASGATGATGGTPGQYAPPAPAASLAGRGVSRSIRRAPARGARRDLDADAEDEVLDRR